MAVNPPSLMLKVIWLIHFTLTTWASLSGFLAVDTFWISQAGILAFCFWAIVDANSVDAVIMTIATTFISVVNDIIVIALYEPRGHDIFEENEVGASRRNEYRFALGMSIVNLLIKPVTLFLLYRVYQSRSDGSDFNSGLPSFGSTSSRGGGYSDIDTTGKQEPPSSPYYQQPPPQPPSTEHAN